MPLTQAIILIFTKYPRPGAVKTRLIPHLGEGKAANLQRRMGQAICDTVQQALESTAWQNIEEQTKATSPRAAYRQAGNAVVYYDGCSPKEMHDWLGFYFI